MAAIDTVLFDLDGTLLDTAGDMGAALNAVLVERGRTPLPPEVIRPHVSRGGLALVCLGFGIDRGDRRADELYRRLLAVYAQQLTARTRLFPGMDALLARLDAGNRRYGVVTNKPAFLTEPLLRAMRLAERMVCVVSGDTLARRKPHPDQLLHACEVAGARVDRAVYIGDDRRDIEAGRAAGMRTLAAAYGYIAPGENPRDWGASAVVGSVEDIGRWLDVGGDGDGDGGLGEDAGRGDGR
ncbi:MAG: HAD-IA family hydrolase [Gammaproteobacteria bacterium]|nr:HAD-IA family hydrolase [Gammaproteobacteria bacterium]